MTWLWHICSKRPLKPVRKSAGRMPALPSAAVAALFAGLVATVTMQACTVAGQVVLVNSDQPAVKGKHDYSGVVVWLEPLGNGTSHAAAPAMKQAVMDQHHKMFVPHVLAVEVNTAVDFPNSDPIFHNAFSNGDSQVFDLH